MLPFIAASQTCCGCLGGDDMALLVGHCFFTCMLANDVRWGIDGATTKARWLACGMEHENMALAGDDDIVLMIEGMGQ
jgi:hypothetical protein